MPFVSLPSKPQAQIAFDISGVDKTEDQNGVLIVFINGLGLPAASWRSVISIMRASDGSHKPRILTYDRFGQGATTDRDPLDDRPGAEPGYGHDLLDATKDVHELLTRVAPPSSRPRILIFVAASIGAHIARLYIQHHPGQVSGLLILDSNIGNREYSDLWPDAHAAGFDPEDVIADDCTLEQYLEASVKLPRIFNSDVKNPEGLDRRNVKDLLPESGVPKLVGPDGRGLWLTVVGHDPEAFADEGLSKMGIPRSLSMRFTDPAWKRYNEGLLDLTDAGRSRGVVIAPGCGHFIQKDNPEFVATQLEELLGRVISAA